MTSPQRFALIMQHLTTNSAPLYQHTVLFTINVPRGDYTGPLHGYSTLTTWKQVGNGHTCNPWSHPC